MPVRAMSLLVQGESKSGKSTLGSTTPAPRLLIDIEGGYRFLPIKPVMWDPVNQAPPEPSADWDTAVVRVTHYDEVVKAFEWLRSGKHPFESVIIDSISELQQRLIEKLVGRGMVQTSQWGDVLRQFSGLMRDFRDLCDHPTKPLQAVVLIAMSKTGANGKGRPWLQGQSAVVLPYLFDISAAMFVQTWVNEAGEQEKVHRLLIGANQLYETGERVGGRLPGWIDNPNVVDMLDMVFPDSVQKPATKK